MKLKFVLSLFLLGCSLSVFAQGYKDGVEYYNVNQFEKAKILLLRNLDKPDTDKALSYFYLGSISMVNNKLDEAKAYFDKGLAANPENPFNYVGLGAYSLKNNDPKAAEDFFKDAENKDKKNPKVHVAIAFSYYKADPVEYAKKIEKYIKKAKKADKNHPAPYIFEGDVLAAQKKWGDAAGYYEMAENFDKNCIEAYVKYANTYFNVNPDVAIQKLETLIGINPNSALAQRELAEKLYENDQWTKAAEVYGDYIKNPNHFKEDEERYVVLLYFGKKYQESFDLAQKLLAENPDLFLMKRMVFLCKANMKEYEEAAVLAEKFFAHNDPTKIYTSNDYTTYAEVLTQLGRHDEAVAMYEKAVEINPEKTEILKNLSSAFMDKEDYVKAAYYYQKFVDAGEHTTNDLFVLAGRYQNIVATSNDSVAADSIQKKEAFDNAIKYIDIVIEKVPNDYRIYQRKARIMMVNEKSVTEGSAVPCYEKVIEILSADPESKTTKADAYKEAYNYIAGHKLQSGDVEGAKLYYQKFLEYDPENTALREFIEKLK